MATTYSAAEVQRQVRVYLIVFIVLAFLTALTVTAAYLPIHHNLATAMALTIATAKATLIACYFMHLISERKLIYAVLRAHSKITSHLVYRGSMV